MSLPRHSIFSVMALAMLQVSAFSTATPVTSPSPSFNCTQAKTLVEQAICAQPKLSEQDQQLNTAFNSLRLGLKGFPHDLTQVQHAFLQAREQECASSDDIVACIQRKTQYRLDYLQGLLQHKQMEFDVAVASIPNHPTLAAQQLQQLVGLADPVSSSAKAWLVYIALFYPKAGVSSQQAQTYYAELRQHLRGLEYYWDIFEFPEQVNKKAAFYLIRAVSDNVVSDDNVELYKTVECPHRFSFEQQPALAYEAFGPLYGSTRDSHNQLICFFSDGIYAVISQHLGAVLKPIDAAAYEQSGTIRYGYFAGMSLEGMRYQLEPTRYLHQKYQVLSARNLQKIKAYESKPYWSDTHTNAYIDAELKATRAVAYWLSERTRLSSRQVNTAARGIVGQYVALNLDWYADNL